MTELYLAPTPATRQGPLSPEQLRAACEAGLVAAETPCIVRGETEWSTVQAVLAQYPLPAEEAPAAPLPPVDGLPLPPEEDLPPVDELPLPPEEELPPVDDLPPAPPTDDLPLPPSPEGTRYPRSLKIGVGAAALILAAGIGGFCLMPSADGNGRSAASPQKVAARLSVPKPRLSVRTDEEARTRLMRSARRIHQTAQSLKLAEFGPQPGVTLDKVKEDIRRSGVNEFLLLGSLAGDLEVCAYAVETQRVSYAVKDVTFVCMYQVDEEILLYLLSKTEGVDDASVALMALFSPRNVFAYALSRSDWGVDAQSLLATICTYDARLYTVDQTPERRQELERLWKNEKENIDYLLTQYKVDLQGGDWEQKLEGNAEKQGRARRYLAEGRDKGTLPQCKAPLPPAPSQTAPVTTDEEFIAAFTEMMKYHTTVNPAGTQSFRKAYPTVASLRKELTRLLEGSREHKLVEMTAAAGSAPCMSYLVEQKDAAIDTRLICSALRMHSDALACELMDKGDFLSEEKEEYGVKCRAKLLDYMVKCGCTAPLRHAVEKGVPIDAAAALVTLLQRHGAYLKQDAREYGTTWQALLKRHIELADYLVELAGTQQSNAPLKAALDYAAPKNEFAQHLRGLMK